MKVASTVLRGRGDSNVALLPDKAARGTQGQIYPWGDAFDANKANTSESAKVDTTPVGSYSPQGDSAFGAADMAGNVWEWCLDWYDEKAYKKLPSGQIKDPSGPTSGNSRVVRGGSWFGLQFFVRPAARDWLTPGSRGYSFGFRVVVAGSSLS